MSFNPLEHSIVHEYSVLFSDRINQKDKKWNDGVLRFYELNGKLEVSNSDDNIIANDFIPSKSNSIIHEKYLRVKNQFQLPTKRLLVEVVEKLSVSERDVSKSFPKKAQTKPNAIKINENIPIALLKLDPNMLNTTTRRRKVGLTRKTNPDMSMKRSLTPIDSNLAKVSTPIKHLNVAKVVKPKVKEDKLITALKSNESKLIEFRVLPRIATLSNKFFQYLHHSFNESSADEPNSGEENVSDREIIQIENNDPAPVIIKKETTIVSNKSVDDADIIYDLSDLEEDDKFHEMLAKIREEQEQQEENKSKYNDDFN
ncbi:hypothetical protein DFJ63DRAFT_317987 [Scheffersomyces coipomensis]|uniref:uncharacterized protein n=1 Tax=Scheffersomyces coipomensis TaxID=1788519 RepID=UPI00315CB908